INEPCCARTRLLDLLVEDFVHGGEKRVTGRDEFAVEVLTLPRDLFPEGELPVARLGPTEAGHCAQLVRAEDLRHVVCAPEAISTPLKRKTGLLARLDEELLDVLRHEPALL